MTGGLEDLRELYRRLAPTTDELDRVHADRLQCGKGCSSCCLDGLTVFEVEAENIRSNHAELLGQGVPHPEGACAFLDDAGACRIYESRPYVCRTQGYPLRWLAERDDEVVEFRDICPLNEDGPPLETLPEEECWTLGPVEGELARLQHVRDGGEGRRVALRDLFRG